MPGEPITHEQLRAGQMALIDRFAAHENHFRETSAKLFEKVDKAIDASYENRIQIERVQSSIGSVVEGRTHHLSRLEKVEADVAGLVNTDNMHKGERGVWAAIIRSPLAAWFATIALAAWAFITQAGSVKP